MPNEEQKLKPCPFCGGKARISAGYSHRPFGKVWIVTVYCTSCFAFLERMESADALEASGNPDATKRVIWERAVEDWRLEQRRANMLNDDYIKRSDAREYVRHAYHKGLNLMDYIDEVPSADVEPVRHGWWIPHPGHHDFDLCSVCGTGVRRRIYEDGGEIEYNYKICPWCGAKMLPEPPKEEEDE